MMAFMMSGLFFFRFWTKTRDKLLLSFALAFWALGVERIFLFAINVESEGRTFVYFFRLTAYAIIIWAIYQKNRPVTS
jgi:hypothetical protein